MLTAALVAAVFIFVLAVRPPSGQRTTGSVPDNVRERTVVGAFHVHSTRSDGVADVDAIASAAARAGLRFVIFTDHGDATRQPEPPRYLHGVLAIDAVEISTNGGHYVALDMPASPYPLGGDAAAVVEDVRRLGGFGIVAHPDSPKDELRWARPELPTDGIEWLNLDSAWRDESRTALARVVFGYFLRQSAALASILDRPSTALDMWQHQASSRPVVALAGHDAHGGISEGGRRGARAVLNIPSYEASFESFAIRVLLTSAPMGDAHIDGRAVIDALRRGRVFTAIDAIATPAFVDFQMSSASEGKTMSMGESAVFAPGYRVTVRSMVPPGGEVVLLRGSEEIARSGGSSLDAAIDRPGVYRVEVRRPDEGAPWLLTNPIYLTPLEAAAAPPEREYVQVLALSGPAVVEKDPDSRATVSASGNRLLVEYSLRPGARASQYIAVAIPVPPNAPPAAALMFTARGSKPMRISVQARFNDLPAPGASARWVSSVYVSPEARRMVVPFDRFVSVDGVALRPPFTAASSVLFVVDLTNALPGDAGSFELTDVSFAAVR